MTWQESRVATGTVASGVTGGEPAGVYATLARVESGHLNRPGLRAGTGQWTSPVIRG